MSNQRRIGICGATTTPISMLVILLAFICSATAGDDANQLVSDCREMGCRCNGSVFFFCFPYSVWLTVLLTVLQISYCALVAMLTGNRPILFRFVASNVCTYTYELNQRGTIIKKYIYRHKYLKQNIYNGIYMPIYLRYMYRNICIYVCSLYLCHLAFVLFLLVINQ